ncbi:MAG TPA: MFS transporter, partial [Clostridiaceae bacterium]|nr:MFS transporter [Clostridiaceae bacterium]
MKEKGQIYYGWWIVLASFFLMFAGIGILLNCVGVFYSAVLQDLEFSRGAFGFYVTLLALSAMVAFPILGKLMVKYNTQVVIGICILAAGIGFAAYSQCTQLWHFYLVSIIVGAFGAGTSILPASTLLTNWFVEKRGLAMGIAFTGSGIGGMICNPLAQWIIDHYSWQMAYIALGIVFLAVTLPFVIFTIKLHPAMKGMTALGDKDSSTEAPVLIGLSVAEALKSLPFWILAISFLLLELIQLGVQNNVPIFLHDVGHLATFAASVMAAYMGLLVLGKLLLGSVLDKWGPKIGIFFGVTLLVIALFAFMGAGAMPMVILFVVAFAFASPMTTVLPSYMVGDIFGNLDYGAIYGVIQIFAT